MNVYFNIDPLGLEGLGATLHSMVVNCKSPEKLILNFICSNLTPEDKANIELLLKKIGFTGAIKYHTFDSRKEFGHLSSLHGSWTVYGRLLIPKLADSGFVLYLDSDLIIQTDILYLDNFNFQKEPLAAVFGSEAVWSIDWNFLKSAMGWDEHTSYFNSGVILFNIPVWKENNLFEKCMEIGKKHPYELRSCDQALLNAITGGNFAKLPARFNNEWVPAHAEPANAATSIIHFVGSPKPWDFGGKWSHPGYSLWKKYSVPFWEKQYGRITKNKLYRFWKIRKSIVRSWIGMIKNSK